MCMMSKSSKCYLHCAENSHPPILLPHDKEIALGRCEETKITATRCSKGQLSFQANCTDFTVKVRQVGPNTSAMNDVILGRGRERVARHGDSVHFLLGMHKHIVLFNPVPLNGSGKNLKRESMLSNSPDFLECKKSRDDSDSEEAVPAKIETVPAKMVDKNKWRTVNDGQLIYFESKGLISSSKIAAFDMDGTLITTKSGKVFPQNKDDWKVLWPEIPTKLKSLHRDGYKVVILTNQAGISRGKTSASEIKKKIESLMDQLGIPIQAYVATGDSIFRKPAPGMWDFLIEEANSGKEVDMSATFYCGDAAGRPENWAPKKKKDFSCSDRLFAKNLGLRFFTPEEHFLEMKSPPFSVPDFDPSSFFESPPPLVDPSTTKITSDNQELLLMVGFPGSGKSFVCKTYILPAGYTHVNRDTLGNQQKCVSTAKSALEKGYSVVVDNTNPDQESRSKYIDLAKKCKVLCRCAVMNSSITLARHNNKFRELIGEDHEPVSEMVINSYKSKFKDPQLSEGFDEIFKVNVIPKFEDPSHVRLYKMYLLDKY